MIQNRGYTTETRHVDLATLHSEYNIMYSIMHILSVESSEEVLVYFSICLTDVQQQFRFQFQLGQNGEILPFRASLGPHFSKGN
jgi:hypothetical protein